MIYRTKNPSGNLNSMIFGLCSIVDGIVRILTLGFIHSTFTLEWSKRTAKRRMK